MQLFFENYFNGLFNIVDFLDKKEYSYYVYL